MSRALPRGRRRRALPYDAALLLGGCAPPAAVARGRGAPDTLLCSDSERERIAAALLAGTAPPSACVAGPPGAARDAQLRLCAGAAALPLVVVSSCALRGAAPFVALGVARARLVADDSATDTVGNFTTASPLLLRAGAKHVLVLTSESHARRAAAIAGLALGCCGVGATVLPLREAVPAAGGAGGGESRARTARDVL